VAKAALLSLARLRRWCCGWCGLELAAARGARVGGLWLACIGCKYWLGARGRGEIKELHRVRLV